MCFICGELAGYIQDYTKEQMLMEEEIQLKIQYQRTPLFYTFRKHLTSVIPDYLQTVEAYADRRNKNSIRLMKKLGMQICEPESVSQKPAAAGSIYSIL